MQSEQSFYYGIQLQSERKQLFIHICKLLQKMKKNLYFYSLFQKVNLAAGFIHFCIIKPYKYKGKFFFQKNCKIYLHYLYKAL